MIAGDGLHRTAAPAVGRPGLASAAVRVQMRQLQPMLPGARVRAAGGPGHHGVLPGGVAVQVPEPALHAVTVVTCSGRRSSNWRRRRPRAALPAAQAQWLRVATPGAYDLTSAAGPPVRARGTGTGTGTSTGTAACATVPWTGAWPTGQRRPANRRCRVPCPRVCSAGAALAFPRRASIAELSARQSAAGLPRGLARARRQAGRRGD